MDIPPSISRGAQPAIAPEKSSELYIRDYPHRSIAIVSASHVLILRYSPTATSDGIRSACHTPIPPTDPRSALSSSSSSSAAAAAAAAAAAEPLIAKCVVEFSPRSESLLQDYRPLTLRSIYGTLGLIAVDGDVYLAVITRAVRAANLRPGETVERILSVAFYCLSNADFDAIVPNDSFESDLSDAFSVYTGSSPYARRDGTFEHPCNELQKLLSNGSFYYSTDFDVTNRLQNRRINSKAFDIDKFDGSYLWNSFMISPLVQFRSRLIPQEREALDASRILTSAIRGFCSTMTLPQSSSPLGPSRGTKPSYLTLISRLSCRRAGTRFQSRGIDDDGYVANFVETETIFWSPVGALFSYAQVRGSVPLFWEQAPDLLPGRQKIAITRSAEGTQPAFDKHFEDLEHLYGAIHIINLLSETKPAEAELGNLYRSGISHCPLSGRGDGRSDDHSLLRETHYDFHAETKGPAGYEAAQDIRRHIGGSTNGFAYFLAEEMRDAGEQEAGGASSSSRMVVVLEQEGVFRTNCLDCLDRTNLVQTILSQAALEAFLDHRGEAAAADFWIRHSSLWADNGDSLSKIYAGTGALKSSFTRHGKMSLSGAMADMRKSVQRIYHNNFVDPSRQMTIDMLLGRQLGQESVQLLDPISDIVSLELGKRCDDFTSVETISLWTGTFNLNGLTDGLESDLSPWLFPAALGDRQPEVYVVALQEIVELNPQHIMNSNPVKKQLWEQRIKSCLNERQTRLGGERYVLLRSGQLVGAALCIFVRKSTLPMIKNVEGSVKKTGLSGMAGNKGAVAVRLDYANTPLCFVTAHLAAGFANYDERNRDYEMIHQGLRFQRNRRIEDHDGIIWLGDFNYRIGLGLEEVRELLRKQDLATLYENDQLNLQMVAGLAFQFYSEARIGFMPTYKFDVGTDTYDSSDKARIPAWTDRILRKGQIVRQLAYDSALLRCSDHRPVYGLFECRVSIVDEGRRERISKELYERRKAELAVSARQLDEAAEETEEDEPAAYEALEPGLPPASSDRQKWWLANGLPARARLSVPMAANGQAKRLNPARPSNPFGGSEALDWVTPPSSSSSSSPSPSPPRPQPPPPPPRRPSGRTGPPVGKKPAHLAATPAPVDLLEAGTDSKEAAAWQALEPSR